jgi:hypothetical protein
MDWPRWKITWPPSSPDITPLDFSLWRHVKDHVYANPVPDIATLRTRIAAVLEEVDATMLQRVWTGLEYRLDVLRPTKGAHVEVL